MESGQVTPDLVPQVLIASTQFFEGSIVKVVPSTTVPGIDLSDAVTDYVYGIVEAFLTKNRLPLQTDTGGYTGTMDLSTYYPAGMGYTSSSTNATVTGDRVTALVRPVWNAILSARLTAARGTTTGSNLAGLYIAVSTTGAEKATKLDETTINTSITNTQFLTYPSFPGSTLCADPADNSTTRVLVKCFRTQNIQIA